MSTVSPIVAGVMGWPIAHSRSPLLHQTWLKRHQISGHYVPLAIPPDRLEPALRALPALGFAGVNLTIPHKEVAVSIVDRLTPLARATGSVNMVTVLADGTLEGDTTDGMGFVSSLTAAWPVSAIGRGPVLLIGAGGAARAILHALDAAGFGPFRVANRTEQRAHLLAASLPSAQAAVWPWADRARAVADAAIVINTTSQGMSGHPALDLDLTTLAPGTIAADIVYSPLETDFLANARRRGARIVDGLGMLMHQARPAFARWYGIEPVVDADLRAAVEATLP